MKINNKFQMKKIIKGLMCALNIHADHNQSWLLVSVTISGLLGTYIMATLSKAIISELPAQWIATQSLVTAIAALTVGLIWKGRFRRAALSNFFILAIVESTLGFLLGIYLLFYWNVWVFAIVSLIYSTLITNIVGKCLMAFRSVLWTEKDREIYDNNNQVVGSIICITGFALSIVVLPSLKTATFLWAVGCIVDDIGWIIVYRKNQELLKNI